MKIVLNKSQNLYFTSDTHYNHSNLCTGSTEWVNTRPGEVRDFKTLLDMNDSIVDGINSTVGVNDVLFHLGDWSFGNFTEIKKFRDRIKCKNVHLILGNHDKYIKDNKDNIQEIFSSVNNYLDLTVTVFNQTSKNYDKNRFVLFHYPIASWQNIGRGIIHLHGHIHSSIKNKIGPGRVMDVGIDGSSLYKPYSISDIVNILDNRKIGGWLQKNTDHHIFNNRFTIEGFKKWFKKINV